MKTLDEVIADLECCNGGFLDDALHYLKEYRTLQTAYIRAMADIEDNPPLTWRELRTMEGKPVWVELLKGKWKGWDVIGGFDEDDFGIAMVTVRGDDYYKSDLGKTWRAYRKERE